MSIVTTISELAEQWHKSPKALYALAKRNEDPLPLRYLPGDRYGFIVVSELEAWILRNAVLYRERST